MRRTLKPISRPYIVPEQRSLHIANSFITERMLSAVLRKSSFPIGMYGSTKYGRCQYGIEYGIYGTDKYREVVYE